MTVLFKPMRGKYRGIYRTKNYPGGMKARMEFEYDDDDHTVDVALGCYRGLFNAKRVVKTEGQAVGPGGLEVYPFAIETLLAAEPELTRRYGSGIVVFVGAATPRLFKIYASRLKAHGYDYDPGYENDHYGTPYLTKEI